MCFQTVNNMFVSHRKKYLTGDVPSVVDYLVFNEISQFLATLYLYKNSTK